MTLPPKVSRLVAVLLLLVALAACAALERGGQPANAEAERIFHADPRWLGGDAAISVPLGGGRILWLFGDTFVDLEPPYRRSEAAFPRNTIAIQTGDDPRRATMTFAWRSENGAPASFFAEDGKAWFWPGGGTVLSDGTLAIFLHRILATNAAPPLGFESRGYAVVLVANPGDDPRAWRMRRIDGPALPFDALPGAAVARDGDRIIVLAVRPADQAGSFVRFRDTDLQSGRIDAGEWWGVAGWRRVDALGPDGPAFVLPGAGPEASLHWDGCRWVHVASRGFGASDIVMRSASRLTGPWSDATLLLRPPESDAVEPFVYAGKAHVGLRAPPHTMTVGYVANSFAPEDLLTAKGEAGLYWPRLADVAAPSCPQR